MLLETVVVVAAISSSVPSRIRIPIYRVGGFTQSMSLLLPVVSSDIAKASVRVPTAHRGKSIEVRFKDLSAEWRENTAHLSSITDQAMFPAYQRIIGFGAAVIPFIMEELRSEPDQWFWALKSITGADPVVDSDRGNIRAMAAAWISWGRSHGYA